MVRHVDLVAALRSHPLIAQPCGGFDAIEVLDRRANESGTPHFAGVLNHHTVSPARSGPYPSLGICQHGRGGPSPVPGPLCNILGARGGGSISVISNRVANHAGRGDPDVLRRARAGQPAGGRPGPDQSNAGGGPGFVGIEWENDGTGEPWSPRMVDTIVRVNAALCDLFGWDPTAAVIGHLEWTRRKIDPAFHTPAMSMTDLRRMVADCLNTYRGRGPDTPKGWDEMATPDEIRDIVADVVDAKVTEAVGLAVMAITGDQFDPGKIRDADTFTLRDLEAAVKGGVVAVGVEIIRRVGQAQGVTVDAAEVADAITDELARRLAE